MPPRSKIDMLSDDDRKFVLNAIVQRRFSDYEGLEKELAERGIEIGKSSLNRSGQQLERKLAAIKASTEAAAAIAEAAPDDEDKRGSAVMSMVSTGLFNILVDLQELDDEDDAVDRAKLLARIGKSAAELSRASVNQKKFATEVRAKAETAAAAVEKIAKKGGLSAAAVKEIRSQILGIPT